MTTIKSDPTAPVISIAAYRPKPGKDVDLLALAREHVPILRSLGLVTDRTPIMMKSEEGVIVEVFEWKSSNAIEQAHSNPTVLKMWERYDAACTYTRLVDLPESSQMFASFTPIE